MEAVFLCLLVVGRVHATCGSTSCFLVTSGQESVREAGRIRFDFSFRYVDQDRKLAGSSDTDEVLVPKVNFEEGILEPDHHREIATRGTMLQADLAYGITDRLSLTASLPLSVRKDHEHFDDAGTPDEHFTNQDGTNGLGDLLLGARGVLLVRGPHLLVGGLGVEFPTGPYKILDSEGGINEPGIQPGSGSYDGVASLLYSRQITSRKLEWFVSGMYRVNGESDLDYRLGAESLLNAGVRLKMGARATATLQVNRRHSGRDEFFGANVPHTGADFVMLSPGIEIEGGTGGSVYLDVQLPIQERVNESQLAPRTAFVLGVSKSF